MFSNAILPKQSFIHQAAHAKLENIFFVRGQDITGNDVWFYLLVDSGKTRAFKTAKNAQLMKLLDFGKVLYSGFGDQPSDLIKWQMEKKYGFKE
jgi:uncharacterized protein YehS (DUF1456 family)